MNHRICSTLSWYKATNIVVVISIFPGVLPALIQTLSASILIALTLTLAYKAHVSILTFIN